MNNAKLYSPLVLAYIGDSVYEVYVRGRVLSENPAMPAYKLHKESVKYVKAASQAKSIHEMEALLDEDELAGFYSGSKYVCPYYRFYDEYKMVRKQN